MTDYYCDIGEETFSDNAGTSTGAAYTGPAGLQAAIRGTGNATALAAGDTLWIKGGTGNLSGLVLLTCGADVSSTGKGWAIGDSVESNGGGGSSDWIGTIVETYDDGFLAANTMLLVWMEGDNEDDIILANGINNTTQVDTETLTAKSTPGIVLDNNSGTAPGPITCLGVNSSWVEDGTPAVLDGLGLATYNVSSTGPDYLHFRNIHAKDSASHGWYASASSQYCHWENCVADGSGGDGWGGGINWRYSTMHRCKAYDWSGTHGFYLYASILTHCTAYNGNTGFRLYYGGFSG